MIKLFIALALTSFMASPAFADNKAIAVDEMAGYLEFVDYGGALMRIAEIKPQRPLSPDQQHIKSMQARVKQAQQAVKAERARQQIRRAQTSLNSVSN